MYSAPLLNLSQERLVTLYVIDDDHEHYDDDNDDDDDDDDDLRMTM